MNEKYSDIYKVIEKLEEKFSDFERIKIGIACELLMCNHIDRDEAAMLRTMNRDDFFNNISLYTEEMDYDWFYEICEERISKLLG